VPVNDDLLRVAIVAGSNGVLVLLFQHLRKRFPRERINAAWYAFGRAFGKRLRFLIRR
jgi:hypothetical protein